MAGELPRSIGDASGRPFHARSCGEPCHEHTLIQSGKELQKSPFLMVRSLREREWGVKRRLENELFLNPFFVYPIDNDTYITWDDFKIQLNYVVGWQSKF